MHEMRNTYHTTPLHLLALALIQVVALYEARSLDLRFGHGLSRGGESVDLFL